MSERSPSPQRAAYLRTLRRRKRLVLALQILLLAAFLGLWELSARLGWVDAFIVSSPSRVVHTLVGLQNSGDTDFTIQPGERIAQLMVTPVVQAELKIVDELDDTQRGAGGFGSTGK